jgi:maleylacetoacetate isomerase
VSNTVELYSFFRSSASWRVRIALNLKGLDYQTVPVNIRSGAHQNAEYAKTNPGKLVPALNIDAHVLGQSLAIIEYLEETRPNPPLLPSDPYKRAVVRAFAQHVACEIHPLNNTRVLKYLKSDLHVENTDAWYSHWVQEGFHAIEEMVEGPNYCFGNSVSLADVVLVPQIGNAIRFNVDLERFPKLRQINAHLGSLDDFRAAEPEMQPDKALYEPA